MFSVDAPKQNPSDPGPVQDVVRIVVSDDDSCVVDHAVLLASRLPVGTVVTNSLQNDYWNVAVSSADQSAAFSTLDRQPLLNLRAQGDGHRHGALLTERAHQLLEQSPRIVSTQPEPTQRYGGLPGRVAIQVDTDQAKPL